MTWLEATENCDFFATCPRNTEGLLLGELRLLGATEAAETRAGVSFGGPLTLAYRACLWSRVASRVLVRLASFPAASPDDFYEGVYRMPWEDHLDPKGTLAVEVTSTIKRGPLSHLNTHFAEQRVKDAVVDRFRAMTGGRPGVDLARPHIRINLHLTPDEAVVSLDLSGDGLHRRGYRVAGGEAPLKENLAAAILLRAGWPRVAAEGGPLVDPMCGSGTLVIEGALMAADIAPGLEREYWGFLGWRAFDRRPWDDLKAEATERRHEGLKRLPALFGFDGDPRALGGAANNVRRAGLAGRVVLERRQLVALTSPACIPRPAGPAASAPSCPGLVIANPPYGKRLGDITDLIGLYETMGERLRGSFSGWEAAIFTGNPELGAHLGLRAHRVNIFYNGSLPCKLLLFKIGAGFAGSRSAESEVRPGRPPLRRPGTSAAGVMFANRLQKNFRHLRRWAEHESVQCYRVYDADLPEYAVAVDLYGDWAHIQEYAPPATIDPVRARQRLKDVLAAVPEVLQIPADHVALKTRRPQRGADQYRKLRDGGRFLEVEEAGLRFLVNMTDYLDTGLFLDHRVTRGLLRELAAGRRFLNLFAYTGSATVYAAAGGAVSTTSVDLSLTYLEWARRNLELNGFSGAEHAFVRADCLRWLTPNTSAYDLIFLDAPTFSNSKSMRGTLDIQRDHAELVRAAGRLLSPQGVMVFSTNYRRFKLDPAVATEFQVVDITGRTIPPDFRRNPRIHTCFRITPGKVRTPRKTGGSNAT